MRASKKLGQILVDLKVLSPVEVERVLQALSRRADRQKFGQVARDMGLIDEAHVWAALAVQMDLYPGIQLLNLGQVLRLLQTPEPAAVSA